MKCGLLSYVLYSWLRYVDQAKVSYEKKEGKGRDIINWNQKKINALNTTISDHKWLELINNVSHKIFKWILILSDSRELYQYATHWINKQIQLEMRTKQIQAKSKVEEIGVNFILKL